MGNCLTCRAIQTEGEARVAVQSPPKSQQQQGSPSEESSTLEVEQRTSQGGSCKRKPSAIEAFYVLRKTGDVNAKYFFAEQLGRGQFGVVYAAIDKDTGKKYAIKSLSKRRAEVQCNFGKDIRTERSGRNPKAKYVEMSLYFDEVEILYHISGHPNIVQLYDVYEDDDSIHLILELCEGKDWLARLLTHGTYTERQAANTVRVILEALAHCHALGVVHRDVKPDNLLFSDYSDEAIIKLADFGLSAMLHQAALQPFKTGKTDGLLYDAVGSTFYVAPEILKDRGYGKECDIWSLGVVLFVILGGYPPFDGPNEHKVFDAIMYNPLRFNDSTWDHISVNAKDFISRMLCKDPRRRATIPDLLEHPWIADSGVTTAEKPVPDTVVTRLQHFAAMNRFKKEARKVLAAFLPEEEVVGLLNIFKDMDTNKDGVLTLAELRASMVSQGITLPEALAKDLLRCADLNSDGVIDYEEFLAATVHQLRLNKDELMFKAFQHFDADHSGFISEKELRAALAHHGSRLNLEAILHDIDKDNDGCINYEEFCNCLRMQEEGTNPFEVITAPAPKKHGKLLYSQSVQTRRRSRQLSSSQSTHTQRSRAKSSLHADTAGGDLRSQPEGAGGNRVHFQVQGEEGEAGSGGGGGDNGDGGASTKSRRSRSSAGSYGSSSSGKGLPPAGAASSRRRSWKTNSVLRNSKRVINGTQELSAKPRVSIAPQGSLNGSQRKRASMRRQSGLMTSRGSLQTSGSYKEHQPSGRGSSQPQTTARPSREPSRERMVLRDASVRSALRSSAWSGLQAGGLGGERALLPATSAKASVHFPSLHLPNCTVSPSTSQRPSLSFSRHVSARTRDSSFSQSQRPMSSASSITSVTSQYSHCSHSRRKTIAAQRAHASPGKVSRNPSQTSLASCSYPYSNNTNGGEDEDVLEESD